MQLLQGRMQELMDEQTRLRQTINDRKTANILLVMSAMPNQRGAGDDWVCVDLDRVVVQLLSEEARERLGLEDLHTGAWDPQLDDIEDVPWRNYVEGEPLPPDR